MDGMTRQVRAEGGDGMRATIERTDMAHAAVPGQRSDTDGFATVLADALGRLGPALGPTSEARDRARTRIGTLLAAARAS
jgi:hypothetical protein